MSTLAKDELFPRIRTEESFKNKVYAALKDAIVRMDIYSSRDPSMLDERELSEHLGVSRTPIREAVAMLEQDGFLRTVPRRGILVVRKTKREIVEMIQAWAALESMAVRLIALDPQIEVASLRAVVSESPAAYNPAAALDEYSAANIAFHQALVRMSGSKILCDLIDNILLHIRGIRHLPAAKEACAQRSKEEHLAIIGAIETRATEMAEKLSRDHILQLAARVEAHSGTLFE